MAELMPCPFCGGEATIGTVEYGQDSEQKRLNGQSLFFYGSCTMCGANNCGMVGHKSGAIATAKWNTRPAPSPSDAACPECGEALTWETHLNGIMVGGYICWPCREKNPKPSKLPNEQRIKELEAPPPSREGWLTEEVIEKWRISFKMTYTTRGHEELNALCDMALSALRPAPTDKPCCEAECYGCGLKYSTHAHDTCPKCGSILRGETAHIETGKRRALRPAAGGER